MRHAATFRHNVDEILEDWAGGAAGNIIDADDEHVHNAAKHCSADILLTMNTNDFGEAVLLPSDLCTADEFLCLVESSSPFVVRSVTRIQNTHWQGRRDKGHTVESLVEALEHVGCPLFAAHVAEHLRVLAGPVKASKPRRNR
nr:hypothetical protein BJQ95_00731 [Cryobacterium sp. SO1]